jgi:hypothetical protein
MGSEIRLSLYRGRQSETLYQLSSLTHARTAVVTVPRAFSVGDGRIYDPTHGSSQRLFGSALTCVHTEMYTEVGGRSIDPL